MRINCISFSRFLFFAFLFVCISKYFFLLIVTPVTRSHKVNNIKSLYQPLLYSVNKFFWTYFHNRFCSFSASTQIIVLVVSLIAIIVLGPDLNWEFTVFEINLVRKALSYLYLPKQDLLNRATKILINTMISIESQTIFFNFAKLQNRKKSVLLHYTIVTWDLNYNSLANYMHVFFSIQSSID